MTALRKTGANLLIKMREEWDHLETELGVIPIGIAGDAGPDEKSARAGFLKEKPYALIADCWSHQAHKFYLIIYPQMPNFTPQVPLMLGDYYKENPKVAALMDTAVEVVKWFNNHSWCLGKLSEEQTTTYKKVWALILPVITRWTSHFCSLSRLLQVNKAVKLTATRHREEFLDYVGRDAKKIRNANQVLDHVLDNNWWKELTMYVHKWLTYSRHGVY
jgi:hypothetical protein